MSSTRPHERIFALVGALLFLTTSVAVSGFVIWQARSAKNNSSDVKSEATDTSNKVSEENKLEGTKLVGFDSVAKVDKLTAIDIKPGTGEVVKAGATITFHYTGALAKDGTIFQSSHDSGQAVTYPLAQLIKGWQEGIPGMKVGGVRRLLIPAAEAYGDQEKPGIPAGSDLVFDIEVSAVQQ